MLSRLEADVVRRPVSAAEPDPAGRLDRRPRKITSSRTSSPIIAPGYIEGRARLGESHRPIRDGVRAAAEARAAAKRSPGETEEASATVLFFPDRVIASPEGDQTGSERPRRIVEASEENLGEIVLQDNTKVPVKDDKTRGYILNAGRGTEDDHVDRKEIADLLGIRIQDLWKYEKRSRRILDPLGVSLVIKFDGQGGAVFLRDEKPELRKTTTDKPTSPPLFTRGERPEEVHLRDDVTITLQPHQSNVLGLIGEGMHNVQSSDQLAKRLKQVTGQEHNGHYVKNRISEAREVLREAGSDIKIIYDRILGGYYAHHPMTRHEAVAEGTL